MRRWRGINMHPVKGWLQKARGSVGPRTRVSPPKGNDHKFMRFVDFTAAAMNNTVFLYVATRGSCKNRRFGGTCRLHSQDGKNHLARNNINSKEWCLLGCYAV
jgi:hypothetical protein